MRLKEAVDEKKFDIRLRDKLMGSGKLTAADVKGQEQSLEDDSSKMMLVPTGEEKSRESSVEEFTSGANSNNNF